MDGNVGVIAPPAEASASGFSYEEAFSRNLGWLTEWEQQALRAKRIAIAGMGGVGGVHLMTLTRLGIGAFHIADLDRFEIGNFNRQYGATLASIGRPKVDVMAELARQVNPELRVTTFPNGIDDGNLDAFLAGVDLYVDGIDFFALDIRRKIAARCRAAGIPFITAAPLGMGVAFLIFTPDGMSFDEWFQFEGLSENEQYVNFLVGLTPARLQMPYLADPSRVDLAGRRGPSTGAACQLCAGVAAVEALKLLLGRGPVKAAPYFHHFDAYRGRWVTRKLRGGNAHPLQRLAIMIGRRKFAALSRQHRTAVVQTPSAKTEIEKILDLARWTPSGDNTQPWRFHIDQDRVAIELIDDADDLYNYRGGEPTLLSGGMLLELMRIAAHSFGRDLEWTYQGYERGRHRIAAYLPKTGGVAVDPLLAVLPLRSVNRRPYRLKHLTEAQKTALAAALGEAFDVTWHERWEERWRLARINAKATGVRLTTKEAFRIHQRMLDWKRAFSPDGIPAAAAGMSVLSRLIMGWAIGGWWRMRLVNALGGRLFASVEMDYLPGLLSAGYFTVRMKRPAADEASRPSDLLRAGQAMQRFWLTATKLGLALQPTFAPLIFAHYGETAPRSFTETKGAQKRAIKLAETVRETPFAGDPALIFAGRIGTPPRRLNRCRSTRRPLTELLAETR